MKRQFRIPNIFVLPLMAVFTFLFFSVRPVLAHTNIEIGPYTLIIGWETEPVVVGERNALFLDVSEDGQPVVGLESSLEVAVLYGGQTFTGNLQPGSEAGTYTVEILPTVRGQYAVQLGGTIENIEIDEVVQPEEVLPASVLQFPASPPDTLVLQASINELSSQIQTVQIIAIVGVVIGVIGLVVAAVSILRNRR